MQKKPRVKLSVSVDAEVAGWLRRAAAKSRVGLSAVVQRYLKAGYEGRHDK